MNARLRRMWASPQRSRVLRAATILGGVALLGSLLVGVEWLRVARGAQTLESERAALDVARAEAGALRQLDAEFDSREARLRLLRARGFMSEADRVAWAEAVTAAVEELRPLRYKVEVGVESSLPLPPTVQSWYDERGLAVPRLVGNPLQLEVEGLHEQEIAALVERARQAGGAAVRVERCRIERRLEGGALGASCTLRRFALLPPRAPEAST